MQIWEILGYWTLFVAFVFWSGFPIEIQNAFFRILTKGKVQDGMFKVQKPFFCPICLCFWGGVIVGIVYINEFPSAVLFGCLGAFIVGWVIDLLHLLQELWSKIINFLMQKL